MISKEELKRTQPVVYRTLSNALKKNRLAHAYLFVGPKGSPKSDAALLFVQSMMCKHIDEDGFACQECDTCKRVENEDSLDFFWIHSVGTNITKKDVFHPEKKGKTLKQERIKKKDILALQEFFEETSVNQRRVYILEDYDQATPDASNSLLKFLEEPSPGIYGILIANEKANVLPTIQSRCQWIPFRPASSGQLKTQLEDKTDELSASMLASSGYTYDAACALLKEEVFSFLRKEAQFYIEHWQDLETIVHMQTEVFPAKGANTKKEWVQVWLQWILYLVKNEVQDLSFEKKVQIQNICIESFDILRSPVDLALFLDRLYFQIRKVVIE